MSKDKKKDSKKAKSQGEVVTEAMANVTSNAEAAKAALKAGKKLAKERIQLEDPILSLSTPRPVEIVEPQEPQRSVLTAYDMPEKAQKRYQKDMKKLGKLAEAGIEQTMKDVNEWQAQHPEPVPTTSNGGAVELTPESMAVAEPNEPLAEVTTEAQGGVPSGTSAAPRTRTDNLLVLLKQAQESADLDNLPQTVECPRKYTTKNYGVQLVKKYAPEGINAEATEDTFIEPDRDHPKGMWQVTLRIKPKSLGAREAESLKKEEEVVSTSDLPKPETQSIDKQIARQIKQKAVKPAKAGKKKGKK